MGSGGRFSGTCKMATILLIVSQTGPSISVPEDTVPSTQLVTVEPVEMVTQLPDSPLPVSAKTFSLVLEDLEMPSA